MRLAEALLERKALVARINELQGRYTAAKVIEEGSTPDEDANPLLVSIQVGFDELEKLIVAINATNNVVKLEDGKTMMQAIARRDTLKSQIAIFNGICASIRQRNSGRNRYYNEDGPKMVLAEGVGAPYFIKLVDDLSKELRLLDVAIQAANWANDLVA